MNKVKEDVKSNKEVEEVGVGNKVLEDTKITDTLINDRYNVESYSLEHLKKNRGFSSTYIVNLQGTDTVLYNGLLFLAKVKGMVGTKVEILQYPDTNNNNTAIVQATILGVENVNGEYVTAQYTDIGDANPSNCNSRVAKHYIRMASTRAKARALRDYIGINATSSDELDDVPTQPSTPNPCTSLQKAIITELMKIGGITKEQMQKIATETCGHANLGQYSEEMANHLLGALLKTVHATKSSENTNNNVSTDDGTAI